MGKDVTYMELIPNDKRDIAKEISPRQEEEHVGLNPKMRGMFRMWCLTWIITCQA